MNRRKQLITIDEAKEAQGQHTKPCSDCPWSRKSLPGWLGGVSVDTWLKEAHGNVDIPCHTLKGAQCAGSAIYRTNVLKRHVADGVLLLPADRERVFATPTEFKAHHESGPKGSSPPQHNPSSGESPMPKAEVIAMNLKIDGVKAAAQKKFDAAKASAEKKLAAAVAKGQKETGKVVESVAKVDAVLTDIEAVLNSTDGKLTDAKKLAKIKSLVEKGQKVCDKHLA